MNVIDRYGSWAPKILGIFRILVGVMFACHGAQKLFGAFGGLPPGTPKDWMLLTAGPLEFYGGILVAIGLFTRPVAFILSGMMAVGYFYGHARNGFWPKLNGGEPAIFYCWTFLYLSAAGPGSFALDDLISRLRGR